MLGLSLGINKINRSSGSLYSDEYVAMLDYAEGAAITLPSEEQRILQDTLVRSFVSSGIWAELNGLWVFATDSEGFALINWVSPGNYSLTKSATSPVFTTNVGFTQNGSNMNLTATNFFGGNAALFLQSDASVFLHVHTSNSISFVFDLTSTSGMFFSSNFAGTYRIRMNSTQDNSFANSGNNTGLFQVSKAASYKLHRNGIDLGLAFTQANNTRAAGNLSTSVSANGTYSMIAAGSNLQSKSSDFYNAWNTYLTSI